MSQNAARVELAAFCDFPGVQRGAFATLDALDFRPAAKARRVLAALKRLGWVHDRTVGSHKIMKKAGWADDPFSFHDSAERGAAILAKISKTTGLQPGDL